MSKVGGFFKAIWRWFSSLKKSVQLVIYVVLAVAAISMLVGIFFGVKSCKSTDTIETVEAKYFMNETVVVHDNYDVIVYYAKSVETIEYLKNKNDEEKTVLQGNYIEVNLDISQKVDSTLKSHKLDANDFKLRDHSGVYLPLNDIMSLFDINAVDVHIDTDEKGFVRSTAKFNNKNAVKDYTWVGTELTSGETINVTLFFKMSEKYKVEKDLMLLEVDLYTGWAGNKKGEDIVLLNCKRI